MQPFTSTPMKWALAIIIGTAAIIATLEFTCTHTDPPAEYAVAIPELVLQGRALDSLLTTTSSLRDSVQNHFFTLLSIQAGAKYNVNPRVLYAIWKRESSFDPHARGDGDRDSNGVFISGTWRAFGIGQIHLRTARGHVDGPITATMLMDPVFNGFASAKILSDYLALVDGDYVYAISAYQQGPSKAIQQKKKKELPKNWAKYVHPVLTTALVLDH